MDERTNALNSKAINYYYSIGFQDLLEYVFKNWPPKHVRDWKKKIPTVAKDDDKKSQNKKLLVAITLYHPDKVNQARDEKNEPFDDEYKVLCEEIAKLLNSRHQDVKGMSM